MKDSPTATMIFAAGFGTRMGALTKNLPKPLIPVAGMPLIDRALKLASGVTPAHIVANLHYRADQLANHLTPKGVILSHEPQILETGGGLRAALPFLGDGPVYTMNPDIVWKGINPLNLLLKNWKPEQMDALLMCVPLGHALGHSGKGDFFVDQDNRLQRGRDLVFGGAQIIKTEGLSAIRDTAFSLNVLWDRMLAKNRLFGISYPGRWCDVGNPEGIALAEELLADPDV